MARAVRALPSATGELPDVGGVIFASPAEPQTGSIEHAGRAYHDLWRAARGLKAGDDVDAARSNRPGGSQDDLDGSEEPGQNHASAELKKMLAKDSEDLYGVLELGDKRWRATADDIKKAFRRISLLYHPDKVSHLGKEAQENSETHFKKVKKAYDILADKKKRAAYDSIDEVDDSIPSESSVTESNFFAKLAPVFDINARWSSSDRVPSLGDESTNMNEVNKFYDFWYSFKTWRDFSFDLEYDTDQAECREEKRWMERQNSKHVKTRKVEEAARIRRLVDTAYKNDPRIRRAKDEMKEKKEAAKQERQREREAAEQAEMQRQSLAREEDERRQAAEREDRARAKKDKEATKKITRRARQRLRTAVIDRGVLDHENVLVALERCCTNLVAQDIDAVATDVEQVTKGEYDSVFDLLMQALRHPSHSALSGVADVTSSFSSVEVVSGNSSMQNGVTSSALNIRADSCATACTVVLSGSEASSNGSTVSSSQTAVTEDPWSHDELKRLTKALSKFPPGTRDRYEKLSAFVGSRRAESVLAMVNSMRAHKLSSTTAHKVSVTGKSVAKPAVAPEGDDYERFQRDRKKGAAVPPPTYENYNELAPKRTEESKLEMVDNVQGEANGIVRRDKEADKNTGRADTVKADKPPNALGFTPRQQLQLESAMKKYPASLGFDRWQHIATDVSGRTGSECEKRFKELVEYYRAKKKAAQ